MAMQLTWPQQCQHHWICLAEDEDSSAAGPPKNSGGVKGSVAWGLGLLHPEWAGRDGGIYAKENSRGNREERRCNEVLTLTCVSLNFFIIQILFGWINKRSLACNLKKCGKYSNIHRFWNAILWPAEQTTTYYVIHKSNRTETSGHDSCNIMLQNDTFS